MGTSKPLCGLILGHWINRTENAQRLGQIVPGLIAAIERRGYEVKFFPYDTGAGEGSEPRTLEDFITNIYGCMAKERLHHMPVVAYSNGAQIVRAIQATDPSRFDRVLGLGALPRTGIPAGRTLQILFGPVGLKVWNMLMPWCNHTGLTDPRAIAYFLRANWRNPEVIAWAESLKQFMKPEVMWGAGTDIFQLVRPPTWFPVTILGLRKVMPGLTIPSRMLVDENDSFVPDYVTYEGDEQCQIIHSHYGWGHALPFMPPAEMETKLGQDFDWLLGHPR